MCRKKIALLCSIITITALTSGCGSSSAVKNTTGVVIDDYIQGATVCVDSNNNGKRDSGDTPCVTTNATGQFTFASDVSGFPFVMTGGTDVASGKPFTGTYTAPAGSKAVNSLTTIVQAIVKTGTSVAEAQNRVKTSLGVPSNIDLTSYDPIAQLASGSVAEIETAKKVFAQQTSMQTVLDTVSSAIAAVAPGTTTSPADVFDSAATHIATLMTAPATAVAVDVASSDNVKNVIAQVATTENVSIAPELVSAISEQVAASSAQVVASINSSSTNITDIREAAAQIATVVQNNTEATASAIEAGTAPAEIVSNIIEPTVAGNALETAATAVTIATTALATVATTATQPDASTN